jgi:nucleoside-diphosphate kinase
MPAHLAPIDFIIGGKVLIYSRLMTIVDFGDPYTRRLLSPSSDKGTILLSPDSYHNVGKILSDVLSSRLKVTKLQSLLLKEAELEELFPIIGANGPYEQLVKFWCSGTSCIVEVQGPDANSALPSLVKRLRAKYASNDVEAALWSSERLGDFFFSGTRSFATTATLQDCSCGVIRPHAVKNGDFAAILDSILDAGFSVTALQMFQLNKTSAGEFLEVYDGVMPNFADMVTELCTGPVIALEVRAGQDGVVNKFREFVGPWDVEMAQELRPQTIRAKFGRNRTQNAIHCTDLPEDGVTESGYFFDILCSQ